LFWARCNEWLYTTEIQEIGPSFKSWISCLRRPRAYLLPCLLMCNAYEQTFVLMCIATNRQWMTSTRLSLNPDKSQFAEVRFQSSSENHAPCDYLKTMHPATIFFFIKTFTKICILFKLFGLLFVLFWFFCFLLSLCYKPQVVAFI